MTETAIAEHGLIGDPDGRAGQHGGLFPWVSRRYRRSGRTSRGVTEESMWSTRRVGVTSSGVCCALGLELVSLQQLPAASGSVTRDGGGRPG